MLSHSVIVSIVVTVALCLGAPDRGHAQSRSGSAPSQAAPPTGPAHSAAQRAPQRGGASAPPGTGVPGWSESDGSAGAPRSSVGGGPQPKGSATTNGPTTPTNPDRTPIGGIGWLIAAGLGYGTYRLRGGDASGVT